MSLKYFNFCIFLLLNSVYSGDVGDRCSTQDGTSNDGTCKLAYECPVAIRLIQDSGMHPFRRCGFRSLTEIICCPSKPYEVKTTTKKPAPIPTDKFGETPIESLRIADKECQKIVSTNQPPLNLHIIGGDTVSAGEFPHMVALGYERTDGYEFLCGGSLVSDTYVLTAAHCVDTLDQVKPSIARMGVIEIGGRDFSKESDVRIDQIITHPSYIRRTKYHDLALLKLEAPVTFSMEIKPICLYTKDDNPTKPLIITGWGKTSNTRDVKSTLLLKANVSVVARRKCSESYTNWRKLPDGIADTQICAGDPLGLRDTCQGDSGGPLQGLTADDSFYRLVGVTSFGRGCGTPVPGVYTRIARYLDWLEAAVWPDSVI